jgi:hypothetical protein
MGIYSHLWDTKVKLLMDKMIADSKSYRSYMKKLSDWGTYTTATAEWVRIGRRMFRGGSWRTLPTKKASPPPLCGAPALHMDVYHRVHLSEPLTSPSVSILLGPLLLKGRDHVCGAWYPIHSSHTSGKWFYWMNPSPKHSRFLFLRQY